MISNTDDLLVSQDVITLLKNFDLNATVEAVVAQGERWADANAAAAALEETRKSVVSSIALGYIESGIPDARGNVKACPVSQAELRAQADSAYNDHLTMMVAARQEADRARVRYDLARMRLDMIRTLMSTARQEMRMGAGR